MVVCTTTYDAEATTHQIVSENCCVLLHLHGIILPGWLQILIEGNSLGSDDVLQWTALLTREYGRIQEHAHLLDLALLGSQAPRIVKILTHQNDTATRTTEGLVGSRSNDVGIFQWVVQKTCCNQTRRVSHINHEECTHLVGNLAHTCIIPLTAVGTTTTDNQLRFVFQSQLLHFVIIHATGFLVEVIADRVVEESGSVDVATMGKVTTVVEVQTHKSIARLQYCEQYGSISLCTRVRLYIGVLSTKDFLDAFDG